jgi:predicted dehydrogenase
MQLGLIGSGGVARLGHLPGIQSAEGVDIHAICDVNEENLRNVQAEFDVPHIFTDVAAFLESGIEAVTVTSAAEAHHQNVMDASRSGLPVLCEKPLALNQADCAEMMGAMKQANAPLYMAFCYRFSASALKIQELLQQKAIGNVRSLRLIYTWCYGRKHEDGIGSKVRKAYEDRMLEGGPMLDCGQHQIDLARWWLGSEVVDVKGHGAWVENYEAPDHVWAHLTHENGAHTAVEMSYSYGHTCKEWLNEFVYELIGTEGVIRYDRFRETLMLHNGESSREFEYTYSKDFRAMYEEFSRAVASGGSDLLATDQDGVLAVEIAQSATAQAIEEHNQRSTGM